MDIYLKHNANDAVAYLLLGEMHFNNTEYEDTVNDMNRVLVLDRNRREPYLYRFLSNVELGRGQQADEDIDRVLLYYSNSFEARLAIIRLHILQERFGSAVLELDRIQSLAQTDEQKAQAYYWGAIAYENRTDMRNAVKYWQLLLDLPEDAMTAAMRTKAEKSIAALSPPTATQTTKPPTPTRTPSPTRPVTATTTRTPTRTPTP